MKTLRPIHMAIAVTVFALLACVYKFGGAQSQPPQPAPGQQVGRLGKYQLCSGREQWYERNVPVVHEAVLMLDTETGRAWKLADIYGAKKWEPIDPPKTGD
jgi:hypothetical protein